MSERLKPRKPLGPPLYRLGNPPPVHPAMGIEDLGTEVADQCLLDFGERVELMHDLVGRESESTGFGKEAQGGGLTGSDTAGESDGHHI